MQINNKQAYSLLKIEYIKFCQLYDLREADEASKGATVKWLYYVHDVHLYSKLHELHAL